MSAIGITFESGLNFIESTYGPVYKETPILGPASCTKATVNQSTGDIWILSLDVDKNNPQAGTMVKYSTNPKSKVFADTKIYAKDIAVSAFTSKCYYVDSDGAVHLTDMHSTTEQILPAGFYETKRNR